MTLRAALLLVLCLCTPLSAVGEEFRNVEESISGGGFSAIRVAVQELGRKNLDVLGYQITVRQRETSVFVMFDGPNRPPGHRGSWGEKPSFSVELRKGDLALIRSHFVR
jgi:hypothetical protein